MTHLMLPTVLSEKLRSRQPLLWLNPQLGRPLPANAPSHRMIQAAEDRLQRCAPLMASLFPELRRSAGQVESRLVSALALQASPDRPNPRPGAWFVKRDDELPVAGSIKARGGFHEILALAETISIECGVLDKDADRRRLNSAAARQLFSQYSVLVGSTGNLGLSIGVIAAALGFGAVVHMSTDAKLWKKERLRQRGVQVVEHHGDYAKAVTAGRDQARATPRCHFVDDERSLSLFLGYAAGAKYVAAQLAEAGRLVDKKHPLFVYLPCGVGGAPGGLTYGLKALFGPHVHCFFAEPVAAPCMLLQLAAGPDRAISVYDIGLDNRTDADGLSVAQASPLVSPLMASQLSGAYTVSDDQLYHDLASLGNTMGIAVEPSAAAGVSGPDWLLDSSDGREYVNRNQLDLTNSTHVIWLTGGSLVPIEEHQRYLEHARSLV